MKEIPDKSIDLTVTSPPYDDLREYNSVLDFEKIIKELFRIAKDGGIVVWVVGDKVTNGSKSLSSYKQAILFNEIGFNVYDVIIYEKTRSRWRRISPSGSCRPEVWRLSHQVWLLPQWLSPTATRDVHSTVPCPRRL